LSIKRAIPGSGDNQRRLGLLIANTWHIDQQRGPWRERRVMPQSQQQRVMRQVDFGMLQLFLRSCTQLAKLFLVALEQSQVLPQFEITPKAFANFSPELERSSTLGKDKII